MHDLFHCQWVCKLMKTRTYLDFTFINIGRLIPILIYLGRINTQFRIMALDSYSPPHCTSGLHLGISV